jgi:hypothetical protein
MASSSFIEAMNTMKIGEKGSDVYTEEGVGDNRVVLFKSLVRGMAQKDIRRLIRSAPEEHKVDMVVMAFQTRDIRGGKGEKDLFYAMLDGIFVRWPDLVEVLIPLIPEYGCWKDLVKLLTYDFVDKTITTKVIRATASLVKRQFEKDLVAEHPSLLAKWLPRESSKMKLQAKYFAGILFPDIPEGDLRFAAYRKAIASINKKLNTTEITMCTGPWVSLEPGHIPGRNMMVHRKAFFYQNKKAKKDPENEDRRACAEKFRAYLADATSKVKGAGVLYPHEIATKFARGEPSEDETALLEAQWKSIREAAAAAGGLRKVVPMCDFSGSMNGTPFDVSLALGILISEINTEAFKDYIITFDSTPKWVSFKECGSLKEKVETAIEYGQGLSTDFQAACDMILKRLVECKVPVEDAPEDLLVLTDMEFDAACASGSPSRYTGNTYGHVVKTKAWETHVEMIQNSFAAAGYKMPRIIIWNLRASNKDFQSKADQTGVINLSGWSPSMLKAIQGDGIQNLTPYSGMRTILDDKRYDAVRTALCGACGAGAKAESDTSKETA